MIKEKFDKRKLFLKTKFYGVYITAGEYFEQISQNNCQVQKGTAHQSYTIINEELKKAEKIFQLF